MHALSLRLLLLLCLLYSCQSETSPSEASAVHTSDSLTQIASDSPPSSTITPKGAPILQLDLAQYEGKTVSQLLFDPQFDAFLQERLGDAYGDIVGNMGSGEGEILRQDYYLLLGGRILQQEQPHESIIVVSIEGQQLYAATAKMGGPVLRYYGGEQMPQFFIEWLQDHEKEVK